MGFEGKEQKANESGGEESRMESGLHEFLHGLAAAKLNDNPLDGPGEPRQSECGFGLPSVGEWTTWFEAEVNPLSGFKPEPLGCASPVKTGQYILERLTQQELSLFGKIVQASIDQVNHRSC
jgi:hypothetical protein